MAEQSPSRRKRRQEGQEVERRTPAEVEEKGSSKGAAAVKAATLVTNLIKLGGLAIAGNEALLQESPHDPVVFAVAAFMMAGAQGLDSFLTNFLGDRQKP